MVRYLKRASLAGELLEDGYKPQKGGCEGSVSEGNRSAYQCTKFRVPM